MAGSVNKVILVGNLGRDPEIRSMPNGDRIANLSIATSEQWRDAVVYASKRLISATQEVREEVAREHEEKMDRLLEGEWQAGYVAGNNDQLNGTICGRRRAANEGIARGGEQG